MRIITTLALVAFSALACANGDEMILEKQDTLSLKVLNVSSSETTVLRISGLSGHSAWAVRDVTERLDDNCLTIVVHLTQFNKASLRGDFVYETTIPGSVKAVCFGSMQAPIWKR